MFNGNVYLLTCLVTLEMDLIELLLNVPQNMPCEILFATVDALKAWHIIDNKVFVVVAVNVLCVYRVEVFMTTENALGMHHAPRSYGFVNCGGVGI
jgi:hypothetical protein